MEEQFKNEIVLEPFCDDREEKQNRINKICGNDFSELSHENRSITPMIADENWKEKEGRSFFIRWDNQDVGLIFISKHNEMSKLTNSYTIFELFIAKKYRRLGIGKSAVFKVFDMFRGDWEIFICNNNVITHNFWDHVIKEYTKGKFVFGYAEKCDFAGFIFKT